MKQEKEGRDKEWLHDEFAKVKALNKYGLAFGPKHDFLLCI